MTEYALGRLPGDPHRPRLKLSAFATIAHPAPVAVDWTSKVANRPLYRNDVIGDCTCAAAAHLEQSWSKYARGRTWTASTTAVVRAYRAVSGFDPISGANDDGAIMQDVLDYWRKTGLTAGHRIAAFAEVPRTRWDIARAALASLGGLYVGALLPASVFDELDAGRPWASMGDPIIGGHAMHVGGYDDRTGLWTLTTWGRTHHATDAWMRRYVDEVWAIVTPSWLSRDQTRTPLGVDRDALAVEFRALTGKEFAWPSS